MDIKPDSQRLGKHEACMLGDPRSCEAQKCDGCGWTKSEIERRRRLPFWLDPRTGLEYKRVGRTRS